MKVVVIGPDLQVAESVGLSMRIRWPDTIPLVAVTAEEGFQALEQAQAHVVILQADLPNMSMAKVYCKSSGRLRILRFWFLVKGVRPKW